MKAHQVLGKAGDVARQVAVLKPAGSEGLCWGVGHTRQGPKGDRTSVQATHRVGWGLVLELVLEGVVWPGALG